MKTASALHAFKDRTGILRGATFGVPVRVLEAFYQYGVLRLKVCPEYDGMTIAIVNADRVTLDGEPNV